MSNMGMTYQQHGDNMPQHGGIGTVSSTTEIFPPILKKTHGGTVLFRSVPPCVFHFKSAVVITASAFHRAKRPLDQVLSAQNATANAFPDKSAMYPVLTPSVSDFSDITPPILFSSAYSPAVCAL